MAGSEQDGVDGADPDLFVGATWVLTPTADTDADAFTTVRELVGRVGAEVIAVTPERPRCARRAREPRAAARGDDADGRRRPRSDEEHRTLLRLAAGGFRDMTRIAAGHPGDLARHPRREPRRGARRRSTTYLDALGRVRELVAAGDRDGLLDAARSGHAPRGATCPWTPRSRASWWSCASPSPTARACIAEVTTLAGRLGVNVADIEIAHSVEGGARRARARRRRRPTPTARSAACTNADTTRTRTELP